MASLCHANGHTLSGSSLDLHVLVDMFDSMLEHSKSSNGVMLDSSTLCSLSSEDKKPSSAPTDVADRSVETDCVCDSDSANVFRPDQQQGAEEKQKEEEAVRFSAASRSFNSHKLTSTFTDTSHLETVDELDVSKSSSDSLTSFVLNSGGRSTVDTMSSSLSMSTVTDYGSGLCLKRCFLEARRPLSISSSSSSTSATSSSSGRGSSLPRGVGWGTYGPGDDDEEEDPGGNGVSARGRKLTGSDSADSGLSSPVASGYLTPLGSVTPAPTAAPARAAPAPAAPLTSCQSAGVTCEVSGVGGAGAGACGPRRSCSGYCGRVVEELVGTETDYVRDLRQVLEGYLFYWRENPEPGLTEHHLSTLFQRLLDIVQCNSEFLVLLTRAGTDVVCVSQCFVTHAPRFAVYIGYCTEYPSTVGVLSSLMRCEDSARLFRERQLSLGHALPLGSYLLKPVQRILKYRLLLQNMLTCDKSGAGDGAASAAIGDALAAMSRLAALINDMKRRHEHAVRVQEIQSMLYHWQGEDLTTYGELVAEGAFREPRARSWRHVFLFDTMLLIAKRRNDSTLVYKSHIMCSNLMLIESVSSDRCMFQVTPFDNPKHAITLQARTLEQKREWVLQLKRAILESYHIHIPGHARDLLMKLGQENSLAHQLQMKTSANHHGSTQSVSDYWQRRKFRHNNNNNNNNNSGVGSSGGVRTTTTTTTVGHSQAQLSADKQQCSLSPPVVPPAGDPTADQLTDALDTLPTGHCQQQQQQQQQLQTPRRKEHNHCSLTDSRKLGVRRSLMLLRRHSEPFFARLTSPPPTTSPITSPKQSQLSSRRHASDHRLAVDDVSDDVSCGQMTSSLMSLDERVSDSDNTNDDHTNDHYYDNDHPDDGDDNGDDVGDDNGDDNGDEDDSGRVTNSAVLAVQSDGCTEYISFADYMTSGGGIGGLGGVGGLGGDAAPAKNNINNSNSSFIGNDSDQVTVGGGGVHTSLTRWRLRRSCRRSSTTTTPTTKTTVQQKLQEEEEQQQQQQLPHQLSQLLVGSWRRRRRVASRSPLVAAADWRDHLPSPVVSTASAAANKPVNEGGGSLAECDASVDRVLGGSETPLALPLALPLIGEDSVHPSHRVYGARVSPTALRQLVRSFRNRLGVRRSVIHVPASPMPLMEAAADGATATATAAAALKSTCGDSGVLCPSPLSVQPVAVAAGAAAAAVAAEIVECDYYEQRLEVQLERAHRAPQLVHVSSSSSSYSSSSSSRDSAVYSDSDSTTTTTLGTDTASAPTTAPVTATASPAAVITTATAAVVTTATAAVTAAGSISAGSISASSCHTPEPHSAATGGEADECPASVPAAVAASAADNPVADTLTARAATISAQTAATVADDQARAAPCDNAHTLLNRCPVPADVCVSLFGVTAAATATVSAGQPAGVIGPLGGHDNQMSVGTHLSVRQRLLQFNAERAGAAAAMSNRTPSIGTVKKLSERRDELHKWRLAGGQRGAAAFVADVPLSKGWVSRVVEKLQTPDSEPTD